MNYSTNTKRKVKQCSWWIFIGLCIGITPYMFHLADLERGYTNGVGGEIFIPFIPILVYMIKDSIKQIMREVFRNEQ